MCVFFFAKSFWYVLYRYPRLVQLFVCGLRVLFGRWPFDYCVILYCVVLIGIVVIVVEIIVEKSSIKNP